MTNSSPSSCSCSRLTVPVDPATWTAHCPTCHRPFQAEFGQQTLYITKHSTYHSESRPGNKSSSGSGSGSGTIKCGELVPSITDLLPALTNQQWFMVRYHACHPGFILQMRLSTLIDLIATKQLHYAVGEDGEPYRQ